MKRLLVMSIVVAVVGLLTVTIVSAEGAQERFEGNAPAPVQNQYYTGERLSIEGTVKLTAAGVKLNGTDGKEYTLMYPRFLAEGVQVEDGANMAVEGFLVPGPRWNTEEKKNYLRVEQASIDGSEYDLAALMGSEYGHRRGFHEHGLWTHSNNGFGPRGGARPGTGGPGMSGGPGYRW